MPFCVTEGDTVSEVSEPSSRKPKFLNWPLGTEARFSLPEVT